MSGDKQISIWFFIGVLLLIYGALILISGVRELYSPPSRAVILAEFHAPIWWGGLLLFLGGLYTYVYSPGRRRGHR